MTKRAVIALRAREASLKRKLRAHFKRLGFQRNPDGTLLAQSLSKDAYRDAHSHQRVQKLAANDAWLQRSAPTLIKYFASGAEVEPARISPRLEAAPGGSLQGDIFRFAGLYWRIPISEGYGRRMRFLVWDESNGKLIGLIALGDAVFNLRARDEHVGWDHHRRSEALVNLMDAYVLGAVPPYNFLLGGKLIACLVRTSEVVGAFGEKYSNSVGVISKERKSPKLVAVTTSSALGRSSVYNRLKLGGQSVFEPIGYTSGWGHFHISDSLFEDLRDFLVYHEDGYADGFKFGQGPNWRLRVIKRSLMLLGLDPNLVRHGFPREVYFCSVATNAIEFLSGRHKRARYAGLPTVAAVSDHALRRWVVPRAERMPDYIAWQAEQFLVELGLTKLSRSVGVESDKWIGQRTS